METHHPPRFSSTRITPSPFQDEASPQGFDLQLLGLQLAVLRSKFAREQSWSMTLMSEEWFPPVN
jgi:hypothetical protein